MDFAANTTATINKLIFGDNGLDGRQFKLLMTFEFVRIRLACRNLLLSATFQLPSLWILKLKKSF
jgi:hypothetical protein